MVDPEKQAAFIAALRKKAEDLAAQNPVFADMRLIGKALVDEARKRIANGNGQTSIGAYLTEGTVSLVEPEATGAEQAGAEILSKLRGLAQEGKIQAAAICNVIDRQIPSGSVEKFVSVHAEHSTGKAVISQIPADEAILMRGVPGASGPAVGMFGGPTNSKIFASGKPNVPILKIALTLDGRITVDGSPATIESLRVSLRLLAPQKGVVWYYREEAQRPAPPLSKEIVMAVIENRLSIRLSSRADYSDAISLKSPTKQKSNLLLVAMIVQC
jgi:hypothetical protein